MTALPVWSTACADWEERIVARRSLVPFEPLFPSEAAEALAIFRDLRIVDLPGRPTIGECCLDWAFDLPRHLFGSYDAASGKRLIQNFFECVGKKNTKSTLAAGIMVTALIRNWRESGEFYILAPTKEVADNSFFPARDMIRADEELLKLLHVQDSQRLITHRTTGAFLKVIAADSETVSGKKTIGLLIDELWLFGMRANAESMIREAEGGLASRDEGFVIYLSTQSPKPPAGVFEQKLNRFRDIRDGKVVDNTSLPIIYEFPKSMVDSKEFEKPENFYIPNPNLGKSVSVDYLVAKREEAAVNGKASLVDFDSKFLNLQVGMALRADGWAGATVWERGVEVGLTLDAILDRSEVVTVGVDGGGLDDLLGVAVIGREKITKRWLGWAHALISDIGQERRKANKEHYDKFEKAGELTKFVYRALAEGEELPENIKFVVDLVKRVSDRGLLAQVGVDAAGIGAIVDALDAIGITQDAEKLDAVRQGIALMGAIKTVEIKLADFSFRHDGGPMLAWCVGNLRVVPTPTAMRVARDEAGFGKVDPAMALFNAAHLMSLNPEAGGLSVYDQLAAEDPQVEGEGPLSSEEEATILRNPAHPMFFKVRDAYEARTFKDDIDA